MISSLSASQINQVLHDQVIGRIGCFADKIIYVVPVTYAFDGKYIYAHSREGMKVAMMRKNPKVCFQVDDIESMVNWRSVIVHGKYEELKTPESQRKVLQILQDRLAPLITSHSVKVGLDASHAPLEIQKEKKAIFYRIKVEEKTGRYEKNS